MLSQVLEQNLTDAQLYVLSNAKPLLQDDTVRQVSWVVLAVLWFSIWSVKSFSRPKGFIAGYRGFWEPAPLVRMRFVTNGREILREGHAKVGLCLR